MLAVIFCYFSVVVPSFAFKCSQKRTSFNFRGQRDNIYLQDVDVSATSQVKLL